MLENHNFCIELSSLIKNKQYFKKDDINIFDSVGFALEDYSILNLVYKLAKEYNIGQNLDIIPELNDVKDLYSCIKE